MNYCTLSALLLFLCLSSYAQLPSKEEQLLIDTFNNHPVRLDSKGKIISWITPQSEAYHKFLRQRWNFIKTGVPNCPGPLPRSNYPQYYFYCAYRVQGDSLIADTWMNDIGERIPNWFESARLYYAYSGDTTVMGIAKRLADYSLDHGTSPADFAWPNFPYTTSNAGEMEFTGFTSAKRFAKHEIQVDHAGDMGLTYYRLFQYTGNEKYLTAALHVANTLANKVRNGTATKSPWPYRVIMNTGKITAEYGANWFGCYQLLDEIQNAGIGNVAKYKEALNKVRNFIMKYPMETGYWTDGHSDTDINSHTYKSNLSVSNAKLFMFDHPEFNPGWKKDIPRLIKWTEDNFITRSAPGEPSSLWGANIVGEQDSFLYKMDYQTARYAAECARWYAISGDESYREKAFRSLNWVTYCNDEKGLAFESPLSKNVSSWWSDCYGEGPMMFYHAFAAIPEWAPPGQDHILYSTGVLKNVAYQPGKIQFTATDKTGKEYLRVTFKPSTITLNGKTINENSDYILKSLQGGDYAITLNRSNAGIVIIAGDKKILQQQPGLVSISINPTKKYQQLDGIGVNANTRSWSNDELKPALDLLIDSMHANIWRVIVETVEKWEDENDNKDPFQFNWNYYNKLYKTPKFQKAWEMIGYLNSRGITGNLMINFMGPVPGWMGKRTITPGLEDEYVEMIVSFLYYARNTKQLKFGLVSPTNESDWKNEGPEINEVQYAKVFRKIIDRMALLGINDVKYVGPDPASMQNGINRYMPQMMKDSVIMTKLAHFGLHSYAGYYANVDSAIKNSPYPQTGFWITEWNAWRDGLDEGKIGVYDFNFASQCVGYLLDLLKNGASGAIEWEGYDSYYEHHYPSLFSYWGILGFDASGKKYTPRKHFYALRQVTQFLKPGSWRVDVSGGDSLHTVAFQDPAIGSLNIVGINNKNYPVPLEAKMQMTSDYAPAAPMEMYYSDSIYHMKKNNVSVAQDGSFKTVIPPRSIFSIVMRMGNENIKPSGWYSGDMHVHRNCGNEIVLNENKLPDMMKENDLDVISLLADMGNGEVKDSKTDLKKINGKDAPQSTGGRIIHWDAEWHWDATYSNFAHQALGGHLVLLGLKEAKQVWEESPYKLLEWAKKQNAVKGFCHMQYLNDSIQDELNCCIPIDYPAEAALGNIDFISEDVYGQKSPNNGNYNSEAAMNAYYKLLNCGFRLGLAAGTDYPCNDYEPPGKLLTFVKIKDELTYQKWIEGIKNGRTVVARNGNKEFLEMKINGFYEPGDELPLNNGKSIDVEVKWTSTIPLNGMIELVSNGKVIARKKGSCRPGTPVVLKVAATFEKSSWVCARRMENSEHQSHTAPVYLIVNKKPIRASARDAQYFVSWMDNILKNIQPGERCNRYFKKDFSAVQKHYSKARDIYKKIASESADKEKQLSDFNITCKKKLRRII